MNTFAQILFFMLLGPIVGLGVIAGIIYTSLCVGFKAVQIFATNFLWTNQQ